MDVNQIMIFICVTVALGTLAENQDSVVLGSVQFDPQTPPDYE